MFAQVLLSGLALGSIYGLVALGFAVVFKATDVFNFAQGMFVVCGAFFAVTAITLLGLPFPLAIAAIIASCATLGVVIHVLLIQPLAGRPMLSVIMLTIALSIVLRALIEMSFALHDRIVMIDRALEHPEPIATEAAANPVAEQVQRLAVAFGRR